MNKEKFFPQNDVYMRAGQSKMKAVSSEHPEEAGEQLDSGAALTDKIARLEKELNELTKFISDEGRDNTLYEEISSENQELKAAIDLYRQSHKEMEERVNVGQETVKNLKDALYQANEQMEQLHAQLSQCRKDLAECKRQNESKNLQGSTVSQKNSQLQDDINRLNEEIGELLSKLHKVTNEYVQEQNFKEQLTLQLQSCNRTIEELRDKVSTYTTRNSELQVANQYLKQEINKLHEISLENQKDIQNKSIQDGMAKDAVIAQLQGQCNTLQKQIQVYQEQIMEIASYKEEIKNANQQIEGLRKSLLKGTNIKNESQKYMKELQESRAQVEQCQTEISQLKAMLEDYKDKLDKSTQHEQNYNKIRQQTVTLKQELSTARKTIIRIEKQCNRLTGQLEGKIKQEQLERDRFLKQQPLKQLLERERVEKIRQQEQLRNKKMGEDPRISLLTNNNTRLQEELLEQKRHENNMRKRLEDKLADLEETQRLQQEQLSKLRSQLRVLQNEHRELQFNFQDEDRTRRRHQTTLQRYSEEIDRKSEEILTLKAATDRAAREHQQLSKKLNQYELLMSKMAEELKQRAEQDKIIKSLSSKNDELELRNSQLASKLADTEFKYNSVAATNDNMQSELAKCSGVLRQLQLSHERKNEDIKNYMMLVKELELSQQRKTEQDSITYEQYGQLIPAQKKNEKIYEVQQEELRKHKRMYEQLVLKYNSTAEKYDDVAKRIKQYEQERNRQRLVEEPKDMRQINELTIDNSVLRCEVLQLQKENQRLLTLTGMQSDTIKDKERLIFSLKQQNIKNIEEDIDKVNKERITISQEKQRLEQQWRNIRNQKQKFDKQKLQGKEILNRERQELLREQSDSNTRIEYRIKQLQDNLSVQQRINADLKRQNQSYAANVHRLQEDVDRAIRNRDSSSSSLKHHPEVKKLQTEIVVLERAFMELQADANRNRSNYQDQMAKLKIENQYHRNTIEQLYKEQRGAFFEQRNNSFEQKAISFETGTNLSSKEHSKLINHYERELQKKNQALANLTDKYEQLLVKYQQAISTNKVSPQVPPITLEPNGAHSNSKWGNSPTSGPSERESLALKEYNSQLRKKIDRLNIELNNLSAFVDTRAAQNSSTPRDTTNVYERICTFIDKLIQQVGQLKKDNQTLRSQKKEIGEQLGEAKRSVEVLEYEKNELQIEAKSSLEKLAFLESRIRSVQGKGQLSHIVSTKQFGIKRNIEQSSGGSLLDNYQSKQNNMRTQLELMRQNRRQLLQKIKRQTNEVAGT